MPSTFLREPRRVKSTRRPKLRLTPLEDRVNPSGSLVSDINTEPQFYGSYPDQMTEANGILFFTAQDRTLGRELWRTDGTAAGTKLVKDIDPASVYGYLGPQALTNVNGTLFFTADDGVNGRELWKSDGTEAGTVMVKDIFSGSQNGYPYSSDPESLTNVNGTLFFTADNGALGRELWKSDGTEAGTVLVKDIHPAPYAYYGFEPRYLTAVGSKLFFTADDVFWGREIWVSDGTEAGTQLVGDINPFTNSSNPRELTDVNGTLYYVADDGFNGHELWKTDVSSGVSQLVKDIRPLDSGSDFAPRELTNAGGALLFIADDGVAGAELWKSDGTPAGTELVKDINTDANAGSYAAELTAIGNTLFFTASDGAIGQELWKSDGTAGGTVLVKDIQPGLFGYNPSLLTNVNGILYFSADDTEHGREIWKSDGSEAGTTLVKDINPGSYAGYGYSSFSDRLKVFDGRLVFFASDGVAGGELWISDGTDAGTSMVRDILAGTRDGYPVNPAVLNGTLFFGADDGIVGRELWKSDGTAAGTVLVKDIFPGGYSSYLFNLTTVGSSVFFTANDGVNGRELWKSDGTAAGTVMVKNIAPGAASSYPTNFAVMNGVLYFTANNVVNSAELWRSDGTPAGTVMVADINLGAGASDPRYLTVVGDTLFFSADGGASGRELWKSDGTAGGTVLVKDFQPGFGDGHPQYLTEYNGSLLFRVNDPTTGVELWITDGTAAGTAVVRDLEPGNNGTFPSDLVEAGGRVFFTAGVNGSGRELWVTDGTAAGTRLVLDIEPGTGGSYPQIHAAYKGLLFFSVSTAADGNELWTSNGTAAGTTLFKDINPGVGDSQVGSAVVAGSGLYFRALSADSGYELWRSDGTPDGTVIDTDAQPGSGSSVPKYLTPSGAGVFFSALDSVHGRELWFTESIVTVTINQSSSQSDPTLAGPIQFTAVFSEPVIGFTSADVDLSASTAGGTLVAAVAESGPMDGTTYTVSVSGMNDDGRVIVSIAAGAAETAFSVLTQASTSTDNTTVFSVPPTVTIEQAAAQGDPVTSGPIVFDVVFSEPVTGFTAADVDLSASTVGGSLIAAVTQLTPSTYTVQVTGMFGAGTVAASIPAGVAQDSVLNFNFASSSIDNVVNYSGFGIVSLDAASFSGSEGGADIVVNVTRSGGTDGDVAFEYAFANVTAIAADYTLSAPAAGALQWLSGESDTKSFTISIPADSLSEIAETFNLVLSNFTGSAAIGTTSAAFTIEKSDPKPLNAGNKFTQKFADEDGDMITVKLAGDKTGSANLYLTNGAGPIGLIEMAGTDSSKARLSIAVKKNKLTGDGSVKLMQVTGTGLKSLTGKTVELDTVGIDLGTNYLGSLTVDSIANGADVKAGGTNLQKTKIKAGVIGDGSDITLGSILSNLSAKSMGDGSIVVPSAGTMSIKGNFAADITINGAGVDHTKGKKSLNRLDVKGIVDGSDIFVVGSIGTVSIYDFLNSRLFGGYAGADDGTTPGGFNTIKTTISSFKTAKNAKLGLTGKFQNSSVIADTIKSATLADVATDNFGDPFGIFVDTDYLKVTLTIGTEKTILKNGTDFPGSGNFDVNVV